MESLVRDKVEKGGCVNLCRAKKFKICSLGTWE